MKTITYSGARGGGHVVVEQPGYTISRLDPRYDLRNHSPDGFSWGFGGSGPAQLALALLAHALADDQRAMRLYQAFKWRVIARLPQDEPWMMTSTEIEDHCAAIEREDAA